MSAKPTEVAVYRTEEPGDEPEPVWCDICARQAHYIVDSPRGTYNIVCGRHLLKAVRRALP